MANWGQDNSLTIHQPVIWGTLGSWVGGASPWLSMEYRRKTVGKQEENVFPIKFQTQNIQEFHAIPRFLRIFFGIFVSHHSLILRTVPISAPHTGLTGNLEASLACSWSRAILAASDQSFRLCATGTATVCPLKLTQAGLIHVLSSTLRQLMRSEISKQPFSWQAKSQMLCKRIHHYSFRMMSKMDKIYTM